MKPKRYLFKFILLLIILILCSSTASAYVVNKTTGGANIKWFTPSATYLINPTGGPSNTLSALQASMQTWTDVVPSIFMFVYGGTSSSTSCANYDGVNLICFGSMGVTGTLAQNSFWYYTVSGQLVESDIKYNTDYAWATDGSAGAYDIQNVGTHEFGHSLSLADLYNAADSEKTMYGYAATGETKKRTLDQDDIDGITYLYPDSTLPTGSITINGGANYTNSTSSTLTLTCSDSGSGCSQMQFSNDNVTYSTPEAYATSKSWPLSTGDGTKTVYAKFRDGAGNWSSAYTDTIILDATAPSTSASPAGGTYTSAQSITLTCNDGSGSGCANRFYCLGAGCTPTTTYSGAINIASSNTLRFYSIDNAGNSESVKTETYAINIDTTPPTTTASPASGTYTSAQSVTLTCNDGSGSGCANRYYCLGAGCTPTTPYSSAINISSSNTLRFYSTDNAGNSETVKTEVYTIILISPEGVSFDLSFNNTGYILHDNAAGGIGRDNGYTIALDSAGRILISGSSRNPAGYPDMVIWRYDANGTPDTTFNGTGHVVYHNAYENYGRGIALDSSGRILVVGTTNNPSGYSDMAIWRYNADGTLDTSFNGTGYVVHNNAAGGNGWDEGNGIALDSSGKILVTGYSYNASYNSDMAIWRYNTNGTLDTSFNGTGYIVHNNAAGGNGFDIGYAIALDSAGRVLVAGISTSSSNGDMAIWRYNINGTLDTSFNGTGYIVHNNAAGGNGFDIGYAIALDSAGRILATGYSTNANYSPKYDMTIWRYNADGTLDASFNSIGYVCSNPENIDGYSNSYAWGRSLTFDSFGKILVAGWISNASSNDDVVVWRYNEDGTADVTFTPSGFIVSHNIVEGGSERGYALTIDSMERILVTGGSVTVRYDTAIEDITPPDGSITINSGAIYTNSTTVMLTLLATDSESGVSRMRFSNDGNPWPSWWWAYAATKEWNLNSGDGTKTVYVQYKDGVGNISATYSSTIILDTSPPTTTASPTDGTYISAQSIILTCNDGTGSGCTGTLYCLGSACTPTTSYSGAINMSSSNTLRFYSTDTAGNSESVKTETYTIDSAAPTGSITINGGATHTNSTSSTLTLTCSDTGSGCSQMQFSNDNVTYSTPEAYATSKSWTLPTGDGTKTVYVKFRDGAGNWSSAYSDTIILDANTPSTSASPAGGTYTSAQNVTLTCNDGTGSGCANALYCLGAGCTPTTPYSGAINVSSSTTLRFYSTDNAGNTESVKSETYTINIDTTPPTGTITINGGATYTNSTSSTLTLTCTDSGSGCSQMQFSNDNITYSTPEAYATSKSWSLSTGDGTKTVYVKFRDGAGNWSSAYSDTIILDANTPSTSASPAGGTYTSAQNVTLTCNDGTGSGCANALYCLGAGCTPTTPYSGAINVSSSTTLRFYSTDNAGNIESVKTEAYTINIDSPPTGTLTINAGAAYINSTSTILTLTCTDTEGICAQMQFSNDNVVWSTPEAYATSKSWTLTSGDGIKIVYVKLKDDTDHWSQAYSDSILLDTVATGEIPAGWYVETVDSEGDVGVGSSIKVDSHNILHISYLRQNSSYPYYHLKYGVGVSGSWMKDTLHTMGSVDSFTSIAIDSNNKSHISFITEGLQYATDSSGFWVTSVIDPVTGNSFFNSLTLDSDNNAHIGYTSNLNNYLLYATNASGSWAVSEVDTTSEYKYFVSTALDSNNKAHISYRNGTSYILKYATNMTGSWVISTVDSASGSGDGASIAVDNINKVHISYRGHDGSLKYATNMTGSWVISTVDNTGYMGENTAIAIDANNKIHISYVKYSDGTYKVGYATNSSGLWETSIVNATCSGWKGMAIALGENNEVHISFLDESNFDMKHAHKVGMTSVTINAGSVLTSSTAVNIALACSDRSGCSQMQFSNDNVTYSTPEAYAATKAWTLLSGDGMKTVYVKFMDGAGNWSSAYTATIKLDTTAPTTTAYPAGGTYTSAQNVTLICSDGTGGGCAGTLYCFGAGCTPSTPYSGTINMASSNSLRFYSTDYLGNSEDVKTETYTINIDTSPPIGSVSINAGASYTNSMSSTLTLTCTDAGSGCSQMQFSNNNTDWSSPEAYATSKTWSLAPDDGTKTVYVRFKDTAGNWSSAYSDTIVLDSAAPTTTASPAGGTYTAAQNVTLTCNDGSGSGCVGIYYTTDGSTPTTGSSVYSVPVNVSATTTLKFLAVDSAGNPESVKTEIYTINLVSYSPPSCSSLSLDGGDRVIVPDNPSLNPSQITVETWVKFDRLAYGVGVTPTDAQYLISKGPDGATGSYFLKQNGNSVSSHTICFEIGPFTQTALACSPLSTLQTNHWYHVAGTYDGQEIKLYLNGNLQDTKSIGSVTFGITSPLAIGFHNLPGWEYHVDGNMTEVRIWNVARTETEIQQAMLQPLNGSEPGLAGYWKFNEGSDQTAHDYSSNSNDGQLGSTSGIDDDDPTWVQESCIHLSGNLVSSTVSAGRIDLAWTAPPDIISTLDHYEIYDAVTHLLLTSTTDASYSFTSLPGITTYSYYVKAVDTEDNDSAPSNILQTTVLPCFYQPLFYDFEPNDDLASSVLGPPRNIVPSPQFYGFIDTAADEDWYQAYAYAGQTIDLSITVQSTGTELGWAAIAPGGAIGHQATGLGTSIPSDSFSYIVPPGGDGYYTIRIWNANGGSAGTRYDADMKVTPQNDTMCPSPITNLTATPVSSTEIDLSWSASSDDYGPVGYGIGDLNANTFFGISRTNSYRVRNLNPNTTYTFGVGAFDAGGNISGGAAITVTTSGDTTPPTGSISINAGATYTNSTSSTLTLTCTDSGSGCSQMQFSNDNVTYSTPEAYAATKSWTLASGDGTKTVYAKFRDGAGNWSSAYSDTIELDTPAPTTTASPAGGTYTTAQNITLTCDDGTGSGCTGTLYCLGSGCTPTTSYSVTISIVTSDTLRFSSSDNAGNVESIKTETYTINADPLSITTSSLPSGTVGAAYNQTLTATGGALPYAWSITSGNLPGGLTVNSSTGVISGTPTTSGTFSFTAQVTDNDTSTAVRNLAITINQPQDLPVKVADSFFSSVQEAYDACTNGDVVQIQAADIYEDIFFDQNISITLRGGYSPDFSGNPSYTPIHGNLIIMNGKVITEKIVVE